MEKENIFTGSLEELPEEIQEIIKMFDGEIWRPPETPPDGIRRWRAQRLLRELDIEMVMYEMFLASFGIDREWERQSKKKSGARYDFIKWVCGGWTTPRFGEFSVAVNDSEIARYIAYNEIYKKYGIFIPIGLRAPLWIPFTWADYDIDHARHNFLDERIVTILETFGAENCLVQYREQSGNFSILMRCKPMYWDKHQRLFRWIAERVGLEVIDGKTEIYPRIDRGRRLPFGDQLVFTGIDALNGAKNPLPTAKSKLEAYIGLMENNCIDPNEILAGLPRWKPQGTATNTSRDESSSEGSDTANDNEPENDTTSKQSDQPKDEDAKKNDTTQEGEETKKKKRKKRKAKKSREQRKAEKKKAANDNKEQSGKSKTEQKKKTGKKKSKENKSRGRPANDNWTDGVRKKRIDENTNYNKQMGRIEQEGLKENHTRHYTQQRLIRWLYGKGLENENIIDRISNWYNSGKTNGFSEEWKHDPEGVLRRLRRHVVTFCAWLDKHWRDDAGNDIEPEPVASEDYRRMAEICEWDLHETTWACRMLQFAKARKQHQNHLYLSARLMRTFRFGRDANRKALLTLMEKGILQYVKRNYIVHDRSRVWKVNWEFSTTGKIVPVDFCWRQALFVSFTKEELYAHTTEKMGHTTYSRWTVGRILKAGKEIEEIELEDASSFKQEQKAANDNTDNKDNSDNQQEDKDTDKKEYANDNTDARDETKYSNGAGNEARAP